MDCPSVNLKFHRDVLNNREELELPKLIDIGSFPTHNLWGIKNGI